MGSPSSDETGESELHLRVRRHRRLLGLGSLAPSSSSGGSQLVVLDSVVVEQQMRAVRTHLEEMVKNASYHMRRDELWKRMLYGQPRTDAKPGQVGEEKCYSAPKIKVSIPSNTFSHSRYSMFVFPIIYISIPNFPCFHSPVPVPL